MLSSLNTWYQNLTYRQMLRVACGLILISSMLLTALPLYMSISYFDLSILATSSQIFQTFISLISAGLVFSILAICGIIGNSKVNLNFLNLYFWVCVLSVSPLIMLAVACFDFQAIFRGWIRHRWTSGLVIIVDCVLLNII